MTMKHTSYSVAEWTGYLFMPEIDALKDLALMLPLSPRVVNIGAGNGTSALALLESRPDLILYTIDIQLESSPYGCLAGEEAVLRSAGFWGDPRYQQIHGDSKVIGQHWLEDGWGGKIDMVFIDGGHLYHEAKGDIEIWRDLINPGGIMAVHDYEKKQKVWPGVNKAVKELLVGQYEQVLFVETLIAFRMPQAESTL